MASACVGNILFACPAELLHIPVQDILKPAFPSAFPLPGFPLNIKMMLSELGF